MRAKALAVAAALLVLATTARADALTDLRASLARLAARDPVRATITVESHSRNDEDGPPEIGKAAFEAEHGPQQGLRVVYAPEVIARAQMEARANQIDPEKAEPTRNGLRRVDPEKLIESLDSAPAMLRRLEMATLVKEQRVNAGGRPARQVTLKLQPKLSKAEAKRVKSFELSMVVHVDDDGIPISAELRQTIKAKFLLMSFEQTALQTWTFVRTGDRLVAVRHEDRTRGSGMGQKFENHEVITVALK